MTFAGMVVLGESDWQKVRNRRYLPQHCRDARRLHLFSYLCAISNYIYIKFIKILDRNTPITSHFSLSLPILHYLHSSQVCIRPQICFSILPPGHNCWLPSGFLGIAGWFAGWSYYRLAEHFSWWGHGAQAGMGFHDMARVDGWIGVDDG